MINSKDIMIVDDESTITAILSKYFSNQGYNVKSFNSPIDAIIELKKKFYPIVISDLNMPDMGGLAFLKWINENTPKTDVILMTGFGTNQIKEMAKQRGAINFLGKPIDLKKLGEFIKSRFSDKHFTGSVKDLSLEDFLKVFLSSKKKRRIVIKDLETQEEGVIYVFDGNIVDAEFKGLKGEKAFYEIALLNSGAFSDEEWKSPSLFTINKSPSFLFEEASKFVNQRKNEANNLTEETILKTKKDKKILVVDDNNLTRLIIEKYLSQRDYNVTIIDSAITGLQMLIKENFDLVLTDINMPGISGLEFLLWIKNNFSKTKVIIMTSLPSDRVKIFAGQNGALSFLEKPINLKELDSFIINNLSESKFSGDLRDISLVDYIKILGFAGDTKKVCIKDIVINKDAFIYIKNGEIIHAEYEDEIGEQAFYKIIKMKYGVFSDLEWSEPESKSINTPLENLLVEAEIANTEVKIDKFSMVENLEKGLQKFDSIGSLIQQERRKENNIDDENMGVYGLYIGRSTKQDVLQKMKDITAIDISLQLDNRLMIFEDISLNITFNEENIIEEISFGESFKGQTYSGLSIGNTLEDAIKIYGKPIAVTIKGAIWKNIACFSKYGDLISSIRIRNSNFFENSTDK